MPDKLAAKFIFSIKQLSNTDKQTLTVFMHSQRTQFSNLTEAKDDRKQGNSLEPQRQTPGHSQSASWAVIIPRK